MCSLEEKFYIPGSPEATPTLMPVSPLLPLTAKCAVAPPSQGEQHSDGDHHALDPNQISSPDSADTPPSTTAGLKLFHLACAMRLQR